MQLEGVLEDFDGLIDPANRLESDSEDIGVAWVIGV